MKKPLVALSLVYVVVVLLSRLLGAILIEEWNKEKIEAGEPIIYVYDVLLIAIKCENTIWDGGIEFFLNYPLMMLQGLFVMFWSPWIFPIVILMWTPILYLGIVAVRKLRSNKS